LEATRDAIAEAAGHSECDEAFVFVLSDANLERYGIRPEHLAQELVANPRVHAHAIFISSMGGAAERLKEAMPPGRCSICLNAKDVPAAFQTAFKASILKGV